MKIRELKKDRGDLDQEVLIKGKITGIRICNDCGRTPIKYRIELESGDILELYHDDIFGVLEKELED